ncbi:MAG: L-histidine N(alpha)-methyltransferase [Filomicrobium sp.]
MSLVKKASLQSTEIAIETDGETAELGFARAMLAGLRQEPKSVPCRFLYDRRGSELFEEITRLPEYYPTRTETAILQDCAEDIRQKTPAGSLLVEFGSGSSTKTEILLDKLDRLAGYVAVDISPAALDDASERLSRRFPDLPIYAVVGNFSSPMTLPDEFSSKPKLGFFPGSTIGNLERDEAVRLLSNMRAILGPGSQLIVGADLKKDAKVLVQAYDDSQGVTAEFNLNLLTRANRELRADFDVASFEHLARYDEAEGRMESYLVSKTDQRVQVLGHTFEFAAGEKVHTENSHKYDISEFAELCRAANWEPLEVYTDSAELFSVHLMKNSAD